MSADQATPPNSSSRKQCWAARDTFFDCLDNHENDRSACHSLLEAFEKACPSSWVKHFEKKREDDLKLQADLKKYNATLIKLG